MVSKKKKKKKEKSSSILILIFRSQFHAETILQFLQGAKNNFDNFAGYDKLLGGMIDKLLGGIGGDASPPGFTPLG